MIVQVSQSPQSSVFVATVSSATGDELLTILTFCDQDSGVVVVHTLDYVFQDALVGDSLTQPYDTSVYIKSLALALAIAEIRGYIQTCCPSATCIFLDFNQTFIYFADAQEVNFSKQKVYASLWHYHAAVSLYHQTMYIIRGRMVKAMRTIGEIRVMLP